MKILLTGATGFIGSHLLHNLIKKHTVFALIRKNSNKERIKNDMNQCSLLNYNSLKDLETIFQRNHFDVVIHLATYYKKNPTTTKDFQQTNNTNILFASKLLELSSKYKVKAFINTGTLFEYKPTNQPIIEESQIQPYNYYAATKIAFEELLKYYVNSKKIRGITLKLFYVYGEKDNKKIIPLLIDAIIKNETLTTTKGEQQLNFTYIDDVVSAYIKAIDFVTSNKYHQYEIYNIGNNKTHSIISIIKKLETISQKKANIYTTAPYPANEIMYMNCETSKAKQMLGWTAKTDITDGLKKTYYFYEKK